MPKFHEFAHPNGRHRVEFFHEKGQTWRYERSDLVKKRWRRTPDPHPKFDSYATALVAAQRVTPWITETLREPSHNWHVELLRGLAFHSARYDASIYGDHHHCSVCWKKFLPPEVEMPAAGTYRDTVQIVSKASVPYCNGGYPRNRRIGNEFPSPRPRHFGIHGGVLHFTRRYTSFRSPTFTMRTKRFSSGIW